MISLYIYIYMSIYTYIYIYYLSLSHTSCYTVHTVHSIHNMYNTRTQRVVYVMLIATALSRAPLFGQARWRAWRRRWRGQAHRDGGIISVSFIITFSIIISISTIKIRVCSICIGISIINRSSSSSSIVIVIMAWLGPPGRGAAPEWWEDMGVSALSV